MRILITGGAGFVGSFLAGHFTRGGHAVVVFDNLHRRGSELNVRIVQEAGAAFVHGDVRSPSDLEELEGHFELLVEASAEPSVHAGMGTSPRYVIDTNVVGVLNCLEFARRRCKGLVFLSSSRVYAVAALRSLPLEARASRLELTNTTPSVAGLTSAGIAEIFATDRPGSFYGASKLGAELLCREYGAHTGLQVVINRCGVIAGPGQFGRTDQGVFALWVARHEFGRPLRYTGFGGKGLQVRDLLHPQDLCDLLDRQLAAWPTVQGQTFNIGGGRAGSVSLQEYTALCRQVTGRETPIAEDLQTTAVDIPWYITDHGKATEMLAWSPRHGPLQIVSDIAAWVRVNGSALADVIA